MNGKGQSQSEIFVSLYDVTSSLFSAFDDVLVFSKAAGEGLFGCELYDLSTGERREIRCGNGEVFSGRFLCASASGEFLYLFEYTAGDRMNVLEFDMRTGEVRFLNDTLPYFGDDCVLVTGIWDGKLCVQIADTRAGVPELVRHYQYWVDCRTGEVTETTLTYQQGALRLFVSVLAEYEDRFLVQSGCRQISVAGDGSTASDNGDAVILPVYSVISKSDYFSNNPVYREIQTAGVSVDVIFGAFGPEMRFFPAFARCLCGMHCGFLPYTVRYNQRLYD